MENAVIYLALILTGLCLGSFAGAMVWRLRARQLAEDRTNHEVYDKDEYQRLKKLTTGDTVRDRSRCLNCPYVLKWYDLIPLVSWLSLRGKCRQCHDSIGCLEPLIELGVMLLFVLSYAFWPYPLGTNLEIARFIIWLVAGVGLAVLFAYDTKWFLLPDKVSFSVIGLGIVSAIVVVLQSADVTSALLSVTGSVVILSGIYLVLYFVSRGQWIGFGDIKLGLGLALLLADWRLAFVALFAANLIGCLVVIPAMISGRLKRNSHVPFGPLLILGFVVAQLAGMYLIEAYLGTVI
ncbi:prepilin peptidase [Candidatus Saccharibacteria bacterium]|nr:prepilin peptidase [Candidatus Saccharibacteria bacterium]